jgi:hypothetical protein
MKNMKKIIAILCLTASVAPQALFAHPGHGETGGYTITHYFTEPVHVLVSVSVLVVTIAAVRLLGRAKQRKESI